MGKKSKDFRKIINTYLKWPIIVGVFFAVINVFLFFTNVKSGIIMTGAMIIYVLAIIGVMVSRHSTLSNAMMDFASSYAQMQKKMLDEFMVPYGLVDNTGRILWLNSAFAEVIGKENYRKSLSSALPELEGFKFEAGVEEQNYTFEYDGKVYRILIEKINLTGINLDVDILMAGASSDLYAAYLFDETEITACKKELHDERFVAGLIYIDNYDEALESIDEVRRSLLIALIDRKINKYFSAGNAIVKKLEKDKYFIVFRYRFLEQLREERFAFLEDVKSVNIGNEMAVTLSVGIGAMNGTFIKNYEMARAAIDLALGRGGDQVVVRDANKVTYYGGKSGSVEKNTRVRARVKAHALRELIEATDNLIIMGHKISDVDAIGASIGIYATARIFSKKAHIVLNDVTTSLQPVVDLYKNNPDYDKDLFVTSEEALAKVGNNTLLVVVDVNRANYTECPELVGKCKNTVVFDHHRQGNDQIENATLSYI